MPSKTLVELSFNWQLTIPHLDKKSGQDAVNIIQKLSKEQGRIVLLITYSHCEKATKNPRERANIELKSVF